MSRHIITEERLIDDIDGTEAVGTATFGWDGELYELELSDRNRERFLKAMHGFSKSARPVKEAKHAAKGKTKARPRPSVNKPGPPPARSKEALADIRRWAKDHGYEVSDRGRIPVSVVAAYDDAHQA